MTTLKRQKTVENPTIDYGEADWIRLTDPLAGPLFIRRGEISAVHRADDRPRETRTEQHGLFLEVRKVPSAGPVEWVTIIRLTTGSAWRVEESVDEVMALLTDSYVGVDEGLDDTEPVPFNLADEIPF